MKPKLQFLRDIGNDSLPAPKMRPSLIELADHCLQCHKDALFFYVARQHWNALIALADAIDQNRELINSARVADAMAFLEGVK